MELWEYPSGSPTVCCKPRLVILPSDNNAASPLVIKQDGSLFIGDPAKNSYYWNSTIPYKLAVNGTVLTQKVKVTMQNWPDYVFDSSYQLQPLDSVKNFISQQHHLNGIKSAKEMSEIGGLDLGENQSKLMQKIEELTLYLIQQNEKLSKQDQLILKMKSEIDEMKKNLK